MSGGTTQKTEQKQTNDPWGPAQPFLIKGLNEASSIYDAQKAANNPGYTGPMVAQPTGAQTAGANAVLNYGVNGLGQANTNLATGNALTGLGTAGVTGAMNGLNAFAGRDLTASNINAAGQYANNPYMNGMVQAATRDASRQFNESTMPGIDMNAAATGNFNSTRAGVAAGIAQRGLQDTIADTSAQLRGASYQQGLSQASADNAQQLQATTAAGQMGNSLLGAGATQTQLGWDGAQKATDIFNIGNALTTQNSQAPIDDALARQDYANTQPWQNVNNAFNIFANAGQQGGTSVSTGKTTTTASPLSTMGSLLGVAGSFMRCDRAVKNVIGRVGTLDNGLTVYLFSYRDDPEAHVFMGPMAQDVEDLMPEAVVEFDGVKHIDTSILFESLTKKGTLH